MSTLVPGTDRFEIVNGPEDGTQFPITRSPVAMGNDQECSVYLHFEPSQPRQSARISVVSGGYRVRCLGSGEIAVDEERVGLLKSRVVREGGIVRVGGTELCLVTAPDGLAQRSSGVPADNDLVWLLRHLQKRVRRFLRANLHYLWRIPRFLLAKWMWVLFAVVIACYFVDEFRYSLLYWVRTLVHAGQGIVERLLS